VKNDIDYDLQSALEHNPQDNGLVIEDIERVLAVVEGENDERDWHWIAKLHDGRIAYISGGCDYTGWDCQSNADSEIFGSIEAALALVPLTDGRDNRPIRAALANQIEAGERTGTRGDDVVGFMKVSGASTLPCIDPLG
jgi:hypothetical protein